MMVDALFVIRKFKKNCIQPYFLHFLNDVFIEYVYFDFFKC